MNSQPPDIKLFALSTCSHCKAVKSLLRNSQCVFKEVDIDQLAPEARKEALAELRAYNRKVSFPTTVVNGQVIVGNKQAELKKAIQTVSA
ncbi:MAG: glutaredoxin family protein [Desulfosarcinaceae bacterium]|jgi:glutaredoxin